MTFLDYFFAFLIDIFHFLGRILLTINTKKLSKIWVILLEQDY